METFYRPLCPEPLHRQDPLQDGNHSVSSPVSPSRRLDGLHRPEGGVIAGSNPSGQLQVLEVRGLRQTQLVSGSLFWPLHGSQSLHQGYGIHLGREVISGRWSLEESALSINIKGLLAVERGLLHFQSLVCDSTVSIFADNSTAIAYLRKSVGTHSIALNTIAQRILRWAESHSSSSSAVYNGVEQCPSRRPVEAQPNPGLGVDPKDGGFHRAPEKMASVGGFVRNLSKSPLFTVFSPFHDLQAIITDALLHSWNNLQVYAFPPWALIPQVLRKLRESSGVLMTLVAPYWPQCPWFPDLLDLAVDRSVSLPLCPDLLRQPLFHRRLLGLRRLSLHAWRLSSDLAGQRISLLQ